MPFIGTLDGETVIPEGVENGTDVTCPECGEQMHPWGPSVDGRARHFQHYSDRECITAGGESATHRKLKSIAVSKLRTVFGERAKRCEPEVVLDASDVSEVEYRQADALVEFKQPDHQLVNGLIIEVQYRNENKNKSSVAFDYLAHGYAVVWVTPDDYENNKLKYTEKELRHQARQNVPVNNMTTRKQRNTFDHHTDLIEVDSTDVTVPATLPLEYFEQVARSLSERKYVCRGCVWAGNEYKIIHDGSAGGTAVCPNCESGIRLNIKQYNE